MYRIGNYVFADSGCHLERGSTTAYLIENTGEIHEVATNLEDMYATTDFIFWSGNKIAQRVIKNGSYGDYKKAIIQKKYSNDDQIAIMLNKDSGLEEDLFAYQKMQEWREWASIVAKKIMSIL